MLTRRWLLTLLVLIGIIPIPNRPRAQAPAAVFHVVGDIDGPGDDGALTIIRDATRVGGVIHAVGGAVTRRVCVPPACLLPPFADTAILWRSDWGTETPQALPEIDPNALQTSLNGGFDISPDGRYIASQARKLVSGAFQPRAVLVDTLLLPDPAANLYLNTIGGKLELGLNTSAGATSDDGTVVWGTGPGPRAIEFNASPIRGGFIAPLPGHTLNSVAPRGSSANGNVVVGSSGSSLPLTRAYRYEHGVGVAAIPLLPGGTNNGALAVSTDGDLVLAVGNSPGHPNSQPYLYRASTGDIQQLGSPNNMLAGAWGPAGRICANNTCNPRSTLGGMSSDGSVVAMNFGSPVNVAPFESGHAYFRNAHGWFHLASVLGANGVDIVANGWQNLFISGISPDGTLVFGAGEHSGVVKGWVAEFAPGVLADFNPQPAPPASTALVGAWALCEPDECGFSGPPDGVVVFTADGVYFEIDEDGFERGLYTYDGSTLAITTLFDNNGTGGASRFNGTSWSPVTVAGDTLSPGGPLGGIRFSGSVAEPFVGAWVFGNPTLPRSSFVGVFLGTDRGSRFFQATDHVEFNGGNVESGVRTYTLAPESTCAPFTHELNIYTLDGELEDLHNCFALSPDGLTVHTLDDDGHTEFPLTRVIDPTVIPAITSASSAAATTGLPFAYQVTAMPAASSFSATGLPNGLEIDPDTGVIDGSPTEVGDFTVTLFGWNRGAAGTAQLDLTIIAPVVVATGPTVVTPIPPEAGEPPPVTIEFTNVTSAGTISVATIDPETVLSAPDPPAGFSLGDDPVYYEITPSAGLTFSGPVTVCFSYAGVTFSGFPRLLHYDVALADWVDITTSVDEATMTICGLTASFSPFAIAASALEAVGFHQPIEPVAGALNTVKGGSTVPLKFNVYAAGHVEITDPAGIHNLAFHMSRVVCETSAHEDDVPFQTTGGTQLRYGDGHFTQNWKTPSNTPGACYLVKVTGDGLLLSARFKVK